MQQNRNLHIHLHLHTFLHVRFVLNHVGGSLHDRRFMSQAGRTRYSAWLIKRLLCRLSGGAIVVGTGLPGSNFTLNLLAGRCLLFCGVHWHFGCLKRHHILPSKSAMGLKFTFAGLLFQALLIILFSVLVDYSDHALPSHSRKGASGDVNITTETLPVNDVSVYYPSKVLGFTCNSCFIRWRIRTIHTSPGFYIQN